ncbi:MAG: hypothetical protein KF802_11205 [Bdellovibrionaceae bacterium]|nr:hypothetical protein [Pseudobdellovibrionaceae bacterium]MBX3032684.1 hypothetical protein [Pseudobdellovibrionaceae bacterium]
MKKPVRSHRRFLTQGVLLLVLCGAHSVASAQVVGVPRRDPMPARNADPSSYLCLPGDSFSTYRQVRLPGQLADIDDNERPVMYPACNLPAEYDCPLFENRPHEELNQAIDIMSQAVATTPECQSMSSALGGIGRNADELRATVQTLQTLLQSNSVEPLPPVQLADLERQITSAIYAANNLGQIFSSNSLLNSRCGREMMSSGKVLVALTDIMNNLAPYALMFAAVNPSIGLPAKFALTGGAAATSAVSSFVQMVETNTIDMNNPEHRKAVLKNTCQFNKIAQKIRFMQWAQSGRIQDVTSELDRQKNAYRALYSAPATEDISQLISRREALEGKTISIEQQMRKDSFNLSYRESQLRDAGNETLQTCLIGAELYRQSMRPGAAYGGLDWNRMGQQGIDALTVTFPATILANMIRAVQMNQPSSGGYNNGSWSTPAPDPNVPADPNQPGADLDPRIIPLINLHDVARKRIGAVYNAAVEGDAKAVQLCAETTTTWVRSLRQALRLTAELANEERLKLENELGQNSSYAQWRDQRDAVKREEVTLSRVEKVMRELAKENSVFDRSELDQRMSLLKGSLFGRRGSWSVGRSPLSEWFNHTLRLHGSRVSSFNDNTQRLLAGSQRLTPGKAESEPLANLNPGIIQAGTRGHEITCQLLESAWLDWSAAIDHLGASEFMCDMIDRHIDNKVERELVSVCRGDINLDGSQRVPSKLQQSKARLKGDRVTTSLSPKEWALLVDKKLTELRCSKPSHNDLN